MVKDVHEELVTSGALAAVALGGSEERRWLDCDLASFAENRLDDRTDPHALSERRRAEWRARATTEAPWPLRERGAYERCYWIMEDGEQAGTVALSNATRGHRSVHLSSFYVYPTFRGRGTGSRALARIEASLARHSLTLRLDTSWCWQPAVRFYLARGMWIYMWKRDLSFYWSPFTPKPKIEIGDTEARISVPMEGRDVELARAERRGGALVLEEAPRELAKDTRLAEAYWHSTSTFSLALALHGFPLIRSQEQWDSSYYADGGPPESLAYKISLWEAYARKHGWAVNTPRIPGLAYPTWDELSARWAAEYKAFQAAQPSSKDSSSG